MRGDSPAVYGCPKHHYGMHRWNVVTRRDTAKPGQPVVAAAATCTQCGLQVSGQDALDLLHGAEL